MPAVLSITRLVATLSRVVELWHRDKLFPPGQLARNYLRFILLFWYLPALRRNATQVRLFQYRVSFSSPEHLLFLFEEIFLSRLYMFSAGNGAPSVLDCGSNIGMSVFFFKLLYPNARILCFEPEPAAFALLERNVRENGLADVTLYNKALQDCEGVASFYYDPDTPAHLKASTSQSRIKRAEATSVEAARLSSFINGTIDFVKLDVEGAEKAVVRDLIQTGKLALINEMAIEYHHHLNAADDSLGEFLVCLERQGFGYRLAATAKSVKQHDKFQDVMVFAYRKSNSAPAGVGRGSDARA